MNKLRLEVAKVAELESQPRGVSWVLKWARKTFHGGLGVHLNVYTQEVAGVPHRLGLRGSW